MISEEVMARAKLRLEEMLAFFGVNAAAAVEEGEGGILELKVAGTATTGQLIGHRGENLRAIQYLLNQIVQHQTGERIFLSVDIAGYKEARSQYLTAQAKELAQKVIETGKERVLKPMSAAERRVIHTALTEVPEVETGSIGEEPRRRVVIKKSQQGAGTG